MQTTRPARLGYDFVQAELKARATRAARQAATVIPAQRTEDVCTEGSCLHARPGTPCECKCAGRHHGERSLLAPASCGGMLILGDLIDGEMRWATCPGAVAGCPACTARDAQRVEMLATPVTAAASARAFARLPQIDDDPAW